MNPESLGSSTSAQSSASIGTGSGGGGGGGSGSIDENAPPLWRYVTRVGKSAVGGGGNATFICNYCQLTYNGSYSRVKAHLLKIKNQGIRVCSKVTNEHLLEMQRLVDQAELRAQSNMPREVPLPTGRTQSVSGLGIGTGTLGIGSLGSFRQEGYEPKKRKATGKTQIEQAFNLETREQLDGEIARMFYSAGLPFHLAKNPHFIHSYAFAANHRHSLSGYVPPSYDALRTNLLQKERANIQRLLEPIKATWKEKGVTLVSDGWTNAQRRPLINFMAVTEGGPMFIKAVNCEGEYKDRHFIANLIKSVIADVGPEHVVQVITDNAPVCKSAGKLVEQTYEHIFWTPCVVHTLNLALKNICAAKNIDTNEQTYEECHWITEVANEAFEIKNFIMNHSMRLAMFNEHVGLKMLVVAETRFASTIIMLKRFVTIKRGLQSMVISDQWSCYREDDTQKAQVVKTKILDDLWWEKINYILSFTEPIYDMLRVTNTDRPSLHLVYDMWDCMIEKVKKAIYAHEGKQIHEESTFYSVVFNILIDRWNKSNTPLHCLAHSLNPRYYSSEWLSEAPNRVAPHMDAEISVERNKCIKRYFPNTEERRIVNVEYAKFSAALEEFSSFDSLHERGYMDPKMWWVVYGTSMPKLQRLAFKLLGQPCSSSCCERNWSTYSFINSLRRNKIIPQRGEDLVYVHTNLRLLSRKSPIYTQGDTKMWDVGGDSFESFDDTGILEVADLSLDEPELEAAVFMEDNDDDEMPMPI